MIGAGSLHFLWVHGQGTIVESVRPGEVPSLQLLDEEQLTWSAAEVRCDVTGAMSRCSSATESLTNYASEVLTRISAMNHILISYVIYLNDL